MEAVPPVAWRHCPYLCFQKMAAFSERRKLLPSHKRSLGLEQKHSLGKKDNSHATRVTLKEEPKLLDFQLLSRGL